MLFCYPKKIMETPLYCQSSPILVTVLFTFLLPGVAVGRAGSLGRLGRRRNGTFMFLTSKVNFVVGLSVVISLELQKRAITGLRICICILESFLDYYYCF